jgi:hypothetical protein
MGFSSCIDFCIDIALFTQERKGLMGSMINCSLNASSADDPFPVIYAKMPYHVM